MARARRGAAFPTAATAAGALVLGVAASTGPPAAHGHAFVPADTGLARLAGEYGLHVRIDGDTMRVYWITAVPGPGRLEVLVDDEQRYETTTPADTAHTAAFRIRGNDPVTLLYGSATDAADRHE
ncbi:MAG: hypothetical protein ACRELX_02185, partial [Longimicrobiales bacterium]